MSSKETPQKTKEEVMAAREAKKKAKQKGKSSGDVSQPPKPIDNQPVTKENIKTTEDKHKSQEKESKPVIPPKTPPKGKDEVDRALATAESIKGITAEKSKDEIKAERAAKKLEKQAKKKGADNAEVSKPIEKAGDVSKNVSETVKNIIDLTKEVQEITAKVNAILLKENLVKKVITKSEDVLFFFAMHPTSLNK